MPQPIWAESPVSIGTDDVLRDRFIRLWQRCISAKPEDHGHSIWLQLVERYSERHRRYHTIRHLAHCLEQLDQTKHLMDHPDSVELAIWFHDVIYAPGDADNEEQSAALFKKLAGNVMDAPLVESVSQLILATTHRAVPKEKDEQFICDIDLSSFGCDWACFKQDSDAVKAEFVGSDEDYQKGKTSFLLSMLALPRIFHTDIFHERYEKKARDNIQRLLKLIEEGRK